MTKKMTKKENHSLSQRILDPAEKKRKPKKISTGKPPAQVLLKLSGSWADDRPAEEIIKALRKNRPFDPQSR